MFNLYIESLISIFRTMSTPSINVTLTLKPTTQTITATLYNEDYVGLDISKSLSPSSLHKPITIQEEEEEIPSFDVTIEEPLTNPTACKHFCKGKTNIINVKLMSAQIKLRVSMNVVRLELREEINMHWLVIVLVKM